MKIFSPHLQSEKSSMQEKKDKIFRKFFEILQTEKCSRFTFERAAFECEVEVAALDLFFPYGIKDIIDIYFAAKLSELAQFNPYESIGIRKKIESSILHSFEILKNDRPQIIRIFKYLMLSQSCILLPKYLYRICDQIWKICGINDTGFSFYTRRISLGALYSACFLHFLKSGISDSLKSFVQSGVERVSSIGKLKNKLTDLFF